MKQTVTYSKAVVDTAMYEVDLEIPAELEDSEEATFEFVQAEFERQMVTDDPPRLVSQDPVCDYADVGDMDLRSSVKCGEKLILQPS